MKLLIIFICISATNVFATQVFKCIDEHGNQSFSDQACPDGLKNEILVYKERSWIKEVDARKPANTNILSVTQDGEDTDFEYQFSKNKEVNNFVALVEKMSGKNAYVLNMIDPDNGVAGIASIKVTSKGSDFFVPVKI